MGENRRTLMKNICHSIAELGVLHVIRARVQDICLIFGYHHINKSMYTLVKVSNVYTSKTWKREKRGLIEYLPYFCRYIDCVYSLEPPRWWGLNKYLQSVIALIRKISNIFKCKPLVLQRRDQTEFRSTCASALSDQTICWSHGVIVAYWRVFVWLRF